MTTPKPLRPWDAGLQNERTTLAWVRTSLALLGTGALVAKQSGETWAAVALLVITIVAPLGMILESERRHHWRERALFEGDPIGALPQLLITTVIATGLSAAAVVIVVL